MNTKEAIEFVKNEIIYFEKEIEICNPNDDMEAQIITANKKLIIKYNQIISLLQQGEKYKQIVEKFTEEWSRYFVIQRRRGEGEPIIRNLFKEIKQKYFPKSIKREEVN